MLSFCIRYECRFPDWNVYPEIKMRWELMIMFFLFFVFFFEHDTRVHPSCHANDQNTNIIFGFYFWFTTQKSTMNLTSAREEDWECFSVSSSVGHKIERKTSYIFVSDPVMFNASLEIHRQQKMKKWLLIDWKASQVWRSENLKKLIEKIESSRFIWIEGHQQRVKLLVQFVLGIKSNGTIIHD